MQHPDFLNLTSKQITEWIAYNHVEPFGMSVQNLQIGRFMALIANMMKAKRVKPYQPHDFAIGAERPKERKQSAGAILEFFTKSFGEKLKIVPKGGKKKRLLPKKKNRK